MHEVERGPTGAVLAECSESPPLTFRERKVRMVKCGSCKNGKIIKPILDPQGRFEGALVERCDRCEGGYVRF